MTVDTTLFDIYSDLGVLHVMQSDAVSTFINAVLEDDAQDHEYINVLRAA